MDKAFAISTQWVTAPFSLRVFPSMKIFSSELASWGSGIGRVVTCHCYSGSCHQPNSELQLWLCIRFRLSRGIQLSKMRDEPVLYTVSKMLAQAWELSFPALHIIFELSLASLALGILCSMKFPQGWEGGKTTCLGWNCYILYKIKNMLNFLIASKKTALRAKATLSISPKVFCLCFSLLVLSMGVCPNRKQLILEREFASNSKYNFLSPEVASFSLKLKLVPSFHGHC